MHEIVVPLAENADDPIDPSYVSAVRCVLDRNAHAFFLRQGGKPEEWGEAAHDNVRDELMKQWQDCPWTRALRHQSRRTAGVAHWVGTSFEVGSILGVNVLDCHAPTPAPSVIPEPHHESHAPYASTMALSSAGPQSYWTARTHLPPSSPQTPQGSSSAGSLLGLGDLSPFSSGSPLLATVSAPASSTEQVPQRGSDAPRSILKHPESSSRKPKTKRDGVSLLDRDAKRKVQIRTRESGPSTDGTDGRRLPSDDEQADETSVSPALVLARSENQVAESSAGATMEALPLHVAPDEVFLRGL